MGLQLSLGVALEAITKDSDASNDAHVENILTKKGMGPNYERLEFLGDCFLKLVSGIVLWEGILIGLMECYRLQPSV